MQSRSREFEHPSDVAIDPDGDIYFCDWANHRIQAYDAEGRYITTFIGDAQELSKRRFALPSAVEFDSRNSRLMVADTQRWRIQIYNKLHDYADPQFNI